MFSGAGTNAGRSSADSLADRTRPPAGPKRSTPVPDIGCAISIAREAQIARFFPKCCCFLFANIL